MWLFAKKLLLFQVAIPSWNTLAADSIGGRADLHHCNKMESTVSLHFSNPEKFSYWIIGNKTMIQNRRIWFLHWLQHTNLRLTKFITASIYLSILPKLISHNFVKPIYWCILLNLRDGKHGFFLFSLVFWMNEWMWWRLYLFFNFKLQCIKMHRVVVSTLEVGTKYLSYFQICYASNI